MEAPSSWRDRETGVFFLENQMRNRRRESEATGPLRCVLFFFWKQRMNLRAGRIYTWEELKASVANTFKSWWQICCRNTGSGRRTEDQWWGTAVWNDPRYSSQAWTSRRLSTWRDRSTLHELWRIIIVNVIVSPGYECYTSVTCSTWSELGSTDTEQGTRVNKTVRLWMERVQTRWLLFVISQTCPWSGWLDDVARLQSESATGFHVKSRLASVSQISTFRPHELAIKKEQLYKVSSPCLDDHQCKKEELESVGEIVRSLLTNCLDVLVLGTNWTTRHSVVGQQACEISPKWTQACDRRWARLICYIHHTNDSRQCCHVGNTAQHCRLGFLSRLRLCWRLWGLEIRLWENLMHRRKSNISHHQLDGQEANTSIQQFYGAWNHFIGCWIAHGWNTCSWSLGRGDWNVTVN